MNALHTDRKAFASPVEFNFFGYRIVDNNTRDSR